MKQFRLPAIAGLSVVLLANAPAGSFLENFSTNPLQNGWQAFGNTNLFQWNSTNQNLEVTWDSAQPNSYFYRPLGTIVDRDDDFSVAFDLRFVEVRTGDTTGPMQMALGFLNLNEAVDPEFFRGAGESPDVAEFDYYPHGYFPGFDSPATAQPAFVDRTSSAFAPMYLSAYECELPTNAWLHIALAYTASNQTAKLSVTTNGVPLASFPDLVLDDPGNSMFVATNDFHATVFSISSYSEAGQYPPYVGSVFARGVVDNFNVTVPSPGIQNFYGGFINGFWQAQFQSRSNWIYTLERTVDLKSWASVSPALAGNGAMLSLADTNLLSGKAFYRVRAERP